MPIRFRCAYCNQLMGIARRKAGTVVRCPTCSGQVVVPNPESAPALEDPSPPPAPDLFERSDFGQDLFTKAPPGAARSPAAADAGFVPVPMQPKFPAPPPQAPAPPANSYDVEPAQFSPSGAFAAPAPQGIFLTTGKITVLAVFVVLLIGVAFFAGMLVGRS